LVKAIYGSGFVPRPATGVFADVPVTHWAAGYIEQLYRFGVTAGCATAPLRFCPDATLSRAEIATFLLRANHGGSYTPPPATGTLFADVSSTYWAASWIEQLFRQGLTTGCAVNPARYCPTSQLTTTELSALLGRQFGTP
jgi:hypothetical protein